MQMMRNIFQYERGSSLSGIMKIAPVLQSAIPSIIMVLILINDDDDDDDDDDDYDLNYVGKRLYIKCHVGNLCNYDNSGFLL
jgi:hypothetical protein